MGWSGQSLIWSLCYDQLMSPAFLIAERGQLLQPSIPQKPYSRIWLLLEIVHTNRTFGRLLEDPATWVDPTSFRVFGKTLKQSLGLVTEPMSRTCGGHQRLGISILQGFGTAAYLGSRSGRTSSSQGMVLTWMEFQSKGPELQGH